MTREENVKPPLYLRKPGDFQKIAFWDFFRPRPFSQIFLRLQGIEPERRSKLEKELNFHYAACGCETGAIFVLISLVLFGAYLLLRPGGLPAIQWMDTAWGFGFFFLAGLVGKGAGLAASYFKLRYRLRQIA